MQNTPLLVMAPAPAAAEPHNTASLVSYRHRSSRPPAVALTHKQTTAKKKAVSRTHTVQSRKAKSGKSASRSFKTSRSRRG